MIGNASMPSIGYWTLTALVVLPATFWASWIDYKFRKVPNWLNGALALAGLAAQTAYFGWSGLGSGTAGLFLGLGCLIVPWAMNGMGAGDVKLMAAIGAWFGPWMCLAAFATGALIGGVMAVIMIFSQRKTHAAMANLGIIFTKISRWDTAFSEYGSARSFGSSSSLLPYGIPLTIGTWIVLVARMTGWWKEI